MEKVYENTYCVYDSAQSLHDALLAVAPKYIEPECMDCAYNPGLCDEHTFEPKEDNRPICSADGCSRREPCGFACRDVGNF